MQEGRKKVRICDFELIPSGNTDNSPIFFPKDENSELFLKETGLIGRGSRNNQEINSVKCDKNEIFELFKKGEDVLFDDFENIDDVQIEEVDCMEDDFVKKGFMDDDEDDFDFQLMDKYADNISEEDFMQATKGSMVSAASVPRSEGLTFVDDHFESVLGEYNNSSSCESEFFDEFPEDMDDTNINDKIPLNSHYLETLLDEFSSKKRTEVNNCNLKNGAYDYIIKNEKSFTFEGDKDDEEDIDAKYREFLESTKKATKPNIDDDLKSATTSQVSYMPKLIKTTKNPSKKIVISKRTGMPKEIVEDDADNEIQTFVSDLKSNYTNITKREKHETPEEKKMRKALLKQYRQIRRLEKKANRVAFTSEKINMTNANINNCKYNGKKLSY